MTPRQRALQELEQLISRGVGSQVLGLKRAEAPSDTQAHEEAESPEAEATEEIDPAELEKLKSLMGD